MPGLLRHPSSPQPISMNHEFYNPSLTGGGSTKSPRGNGSLTNTVYAGSRAVEAMMNDRCDSQAYGVL